MEKFINGVNDLIFKELIKRGYSLEGNTRVWNIADSKLWYLTPEQAQAFLDLEKSEDYQKEVIQKEIDLIKANRDKLLEKIGKGHVNIVDLGCGDGKKATLFIENLQADREKIRYCPIDISDYMVEKALTNIKETNVGEVVDFQWNISDFENLENVAHLLRKGPYKENLFLLLGNTLGNFEINELLYEIRSSMREGDVLIIGNGLNSGSDVKEILKAYDNEFVDNYLVNILTQVGMKREDLEFGVRFKNDRVEIYYTIKTDMKIAFLDKKIYFNKGDQIIVAFSYKYNKDDFKSFMNIYFDDVDVFVSDDGSYALALCKK